VDIHESGHIGTFHSNAMQINLKKSGETMKIHHIGISVKNLEESKRFYQTHFGFSEEFSVVIGNEHIVFLSREGERIELTHDGETFQTHPNVHWAWVIGDLDGEIKRLSHQGLEPVEGPLHLENGWEAVFYNGPDGELIELLSVE
jgi:lactoylglutathione lyase